MDNQMPKMVKYVVDPCYGQVFSSQKDSCIKCWLKKSCESNYKAFLKKQKMAEKNGTDKQQKDKKYKKTDKYRDWS